MDKAFEICEALADARPGSACSELSRTLRLPPATVHRLLAGLRRRGYVRQDEETARYNLTLKMLDLGFRLLGRSEIRLPPTRWCASTCCGPGAARSLPCPRVPR